MKKKEIFYIGILIIASIILPAFTTGKPYDTSTPDNFGKNLIEVLKKQNMEEYKKFYPSLEDYKITISAVTDTTTNKWYQIEFDTSKDHDAQFKKSYDQYTSLINKGKELGIDWSKIEYDAISFTNIKTGDYGIKYIHEAKISFKHNGHMYVSVYGLTMLHNGWGGGDLRGPYYY